MTKIEIQEGLRAGADAWFVVRVDRQGDRDISQGDLHVCTDPFEAERLAEIERDNHGLPPSWLVSPGQPSLDCPDEAWELAGTVEVPRFGRVLELAVAAELRRLAEQSAEPTRDLLAARAAWLRRA